jgi:hypothetical protein
MLLLVLLLRLLLLVQAVQTLIPTPQREVERPVQTVRQYPHHNERWGG